MDSGAEDAFKAALSTVGFKVETDGFAERRPDGARNGFLTIVPPNSKEGLRLSSERERGGDASPNYKIEAVHCEPGDPMRISRASSDRSKVEDALSRIRRGIR